MTLARSKKPVSKKSGRPQTAKRQKRTALAKPPSRPRGESESNLPTAVGVSRRVLPSRSSLVKEAHKVLSRSSWNKEREKQLSRKCSALVAKLKKTCPHLTVERPLKPGEVFGDIHPAATAVEVTALAGRDFLIEIEASAVLQG